MLIYGANVTAADVTLVFPDWPLMGGALVPPFGDMPVGAANLALTHALHRYVGVVVGVALAGTWVVAWRGRRAGRVDATLFRLITIAAWCSTRSRRSWAPSRSGLGSPRGPRRSTSRSPRSCGWPRSAPRSSATTPRAQQPPAVPAPRPACAGQGRHDPRVRRAHQAPDHRAAPRSPRCRRWSSRRATFRVPSTGSHGAGSSAELRGRHARGRQRQRHQPVPRPRHRHSR